MMKTLKTIALLLATITLTLAAQAQQGWQTHPADFAVTYSAERAKLVATGCGCFWLQGGAFDVAVPLYRGLGVAATITGDTASNISPGVDLSKIAFMVGPRYTLRVGHWAGRAPGMRHGSSIFGEGLFGSAHGFNSLFSAGSGFKNSANSFSMQLGGGFNIGLAKGFGLRAIEVDYVRTSFGNLASNRQNDLRLAAGVTYHLGEH